MKEKIIRVGMAEMAVARNPTILAAHSLGSCVGVILYDPLMKIGGLAHIMMPDIDQAKAKKNKAKFANTAIEILLKKMHRSGAEKRRIKAKIVGGADMFFNVNSSGQMKIGEKNTLAVKKELKKEKVKIVAEDTGGNSGRSIRFLTETGNVIVKTILHGEKEI